jgi:hypothetical protein
VLAEFSELDKLTEELLKRDFDEFISIFNKLQENFQSIALEDPINPSQIQELEQVYTELTLKIELVEKFQKDVRLALVNLTNSRKILKKYVAE